MPLFCWSVAAALEEARVRCVGVTTDDPEILSWCKRAQRVDPRIVPIERPAGLATDDAPTEPALIHAVEAVGTGPKEIVLLMQATSPFRHGGLLSEVIDAAATSGSSLTCRSDGQIMWIGGFGGCVPLYDPAHRPRRQDAADGSGYFYEDGNLYACRADILGSRACRIGPGAAIVETDAIQSIQIDSLDELSLCRAAIGLPEISSWLAKLKGVLPRLA